MLETSIKGEVTMRADEYSLAVGERGAPRLRLVEKIYGPGTREVLTRAGLRAGLAVVELGCGIGSVSRWLASVVGPEGRVIGVDVSAEQIASARRATDNERYPNLSFVEASAYQTNLPRASFDLVYCRLLLMHLSRPEDALREMRALLRPGGVFVCEDTDIASSFCEPPCAAQEELHSLALTMSAKAGCDFRISKRLFQLVSEAGFPSPEISQHQPIFARGEEKHFEEMSFAEVAPRVVSAGLASSEKVEEILQKIRAAILDEKVVYSLSRMVQVWSRV